MPTRYWLMKCEPAAYTIDDLARDTRTGWEGVRNYQARNFIRDDMQQGDPVLFYASNADPSGVTGLARIARAGYPDPFAWKKGHKVLRRGQHRGEADLVHRRPGIRRTVSCGRAARDIEADTRPRRDDGHPERQPAVRAAGHPGGVRDRDPPRLARGGLTAPEIETNMEYRQLGSSGLKVPILTFGTGTFGGQTDFFKPWGASDVKEATRLLDVCLDAGLTMFDSADVYSQGQSEEILGRAIAGRRDRVLISTKGTFRSGDGPNDVGSSRFHIMQAVDGSLKRLGTDYIDLYQLHGFDAQTPVGEALRALDDLVRAGKIRYIGASNFSGWHLMKSLAYSDRHNLTRYVAHQAYYSLAGRDYEWELMPLGLDQGVGAVVWSPLGWARLTGKIRRGQPPPKVSRLRDKTNADAAPPLSEEYLFTVVDAIDAVAKETGRTVPQIALNWLLQRPTVATIIIGARNEEQLTQNLGAIGWSLTPEQIARLDAASATPLAYPYWHQRGFTERNPPPV